MIRGIMFWVGFHASYLLTNGFHNPIYCKFKNYRKNAADAIWNFERMFSINVDVRWQYSVVSRFF